MAGPNGKETGVESHRQREEEELAANVLASLIDQPAQLAALRAEGFSPALLPGPFAALAARVLSLIDDGATARATITVRLLEDYREQPERLELAAALEVFPLLEHPQPGALSLVAPLLDRTRRLKRKGARSRLQLHAADPAISDADFATLARNALPEIETEDVGGTLSQSFWLDARGQVALFDTTTLLMDTPTRTFLFEGLLPEGSLTEFIGPPKVGKSAFMQTLAIAAAVGGKAFNLHQANGPRFCMIIGVDQGRLETAERWRRAAKSLGEDALSHVYHWGLPTFLLTEKADVDRLAAWAKWAKEASGAAPLIIIDTLRASIPHEISENSSEVGALISNLRPISNDGASIVIVHHSGHGTESRGDAAAGRGSTSIPGAVDDVWVARGIGEGWIEVSFDARRTGGALKPIGVKVCHEDYGVSTDDPVARKAATLREVVFRWLKENGQAGPNDIAKALTAADGKPRHRAQISNALRALEAEKRVTNIGKGVYRLVSDSVTPSVTTVTPDWHEGATRETGDV